MSKAIRNRNNNTMSESEYFGKLRSILRLGFKRCWIPMQLALEKAKRPSESTNKRLKWEYQCSECKLWFPRNQVHIDHIIPTGSLTCWDDVVPFIQKMTAEDVDAYQILCIEHNYAKAKIEKQERKQAKIELNGRLTNTDSSTKID